MTSHKPLSRILREWQPTQDLPVRTIGGRMRELTPASIDALTDRIDSTLEANQHWVEANPVANNPRLSSARASRKEARRFLEHQVAAALSDRRWKFRTAEGIAREIDVPIAVVRKILDSKTDIARRALVPVAESPLYTHASRPVSLRERLAATLAIGAKRPVKAQVRGAGPAKV